MDAKIREEKAVFVGIIKQNDDERKVMEYLEELEFLAETAGAKGDRKFIQRVDKPEKSTYIRSGKLEEIAAYCEENCIDYVIFDDELTGMQQRNIEKIIKTSAVIDRTSLILEIFSQRAKTAYAKMRQIGIFFSESLLLLTTLKARLFIFPQTIIINYI